MQLALMQLRITNWNGKAMSSTGLTTNGNIATGAASLADSSDFAADPASSTFFAADLKKYGDLKNMLESNKDQLKLEAMKRIIGMIAKGKDASELFPSVVKNVVSKNIEIKKLVYAYLIRYAEEQQDLALLSISTFQRALKDPNQLIRANALRVLSSIRVPVIVPIMMLAIRDCSSDMSPYVRKSAALAIPKLYSLDDEQKEQLVEVIDKLLGDRTTLVIGSAVTAFDEVCPERDDLIHKNYRRLCQILMDLEEWGQVFIINTLTRYARTQFTDPNDKDVEEKNGGEKFYDDDDEEKPVSKKPTVDGDLRLLLRSVKPLLQSRNSAVVMAVIQLYVHIAPRTEMTANIKPMIRLLRSHREIQSVVLSNIATLAAKPEQKALLVPHLKAFFVRSSDPTHIKLQKLEILTNLASEGTIGIILREFQAYISSSDRELIASTIQAIGRCAITISEVTETCLNGLVNLLSNRDDNVVGESVCVIRKLLQLNPTAHKDIIRHLAKLVETIQVPMAKASILWLIGEYCEQVPTIAPDVLRVAVKTFPKEDNIVKLQILNLAAKLLTVNPQQTSLLAVYAFNLAKYDVNYDIRDRSRFLKALVMPGHIGSGDDGSDASTFSNMAHQILMATKPAPVLESRFKERMEFQMGTLSHFLNIRTSGYQDLPDFPLESLPSNVRDVALPPEPERKQSPTKTNRTLQPKKAEKFYSDEESEEEDEEEESDEETDDSDESETDESDEEKSDEEVDGKNKAEKTKTVNGKLKDEAGDSSKDETNTSDSEEDDSSEEESSMSEDEKEKPIVKPKVEKVVSPKAASSTSVPVKNVPQQKAVISQRSPEKQQQTSKSQNLDVLLDFDSDMSSSAPLMSAMQPLIHPITTGKSQSTSAVILPPVYVPTKSYELLSASSNGGFGVSYRYTRRPFMFSEKMVAIEFMFNNTSDKSFANIRVVRKKLPGRVEAQDFHEINSLDGEKVAHATMGVNFVDTTQSISVVLGCDESEYEVTLKPRMGELLRPIMMSRSEFDKNKSSLSGLNENQASVDIPLKLQTESALTSAILEMANVAPVAVKDEAEDTEGTKTLRFAGQTLASSSPVMISVISCGPKVSLVVNSEKAMVGSLVLQEIKDFMIKYK